MNLASVVLLSIMFLSQGLRPDVRVSLEKRIFDLVNDERVKARVPRLSLDPKLADIARAHSAAMAREAFFAHVNQEGQGPSERAQSAGYGCRHLVGRYTYEGIGENILQNNLYDRVTTHDHQVVYAWNNEEKLALSTVRGWLESPPHRENLLSERYIRSGVGIAISSDQKVLITQDFC